MISQSSIDLIFDTSRIEEVIGDFVQLKKAGSNYKGLSPFTSEKTPSFIVSPAKQIFKCFSSGKGGNVVRFLMEHEHYTYPEALRWLAKRYNIELEETEQSPEQLEAQNEKEAVFVLSAFAEKYFHEQLINSDEGKAIGLSYFQQRGISQESIDKFKLGYSPEARNAFAQEAQKKQYNKEVILKSGICIDNERGMFDRFAGRVIFPIHSISGRTLGFGGRILKNNAKAAKYLNSPENPIYHKSKVLYGIYQAKNAIAKEDNCYLVEGYTDVISLHQKGIENVVASSGTALTPEQVRLVSRLSPNLTILYDGDAAGIRAALRGTHIALEEGMNVRILLFPEGQDPDSFARENSPDELKAFLAGNTKDIVEFQCDLLLEEAKGDPVKKAALIRDVIETISLVKDHTLQTLYIQRSATRFEMDEQVLFRELAQKQNKRIRDEEKAAHAQQMRKLTETPVAPSTGPDRLIQDHPQERAIIRLLVGHAHDTAIFETKERIEENGMGTFQMVEEEIPVGPYLIEEIVADEMKFKHPLYQQIFNVFASTFEKEELPAENFFINHPDPQISNLVSDLLSDPYQLSDWAKKDIIVPSKEKKLGLDVLETLHYFKKVKVKEELDSIANQLKNPAPDVDAFDLMTRHQKLKEIERELQALIDSKRF